MKTTIKTTLAVILLLAASQLFAQREKEIQNFEVEGIYLNADNFKSGKLTPLTDKQHAGDKIKLKQFFISPQIISIDDFSSLFSASLTTAHPMLVVPKSNPKIFFISIV